MAVSREAQMIEQAAGAIVEVLAEAVYKTFELRSPEPAREAIAALIGVDQRSAPGENGGPVELMAMLVLRNWAVLVRQELAGRAEWVEQVLAWIEEALGKRYRARARYTSGALRSEEESNEITIYAEALQDDFLPSLVWLLAGTVAVHGDADVNWLLELEPAVEAGR